MIFEGVNDVGGGANTASTQASIANSLISAFTQIVSDAKKAGYTTIGGTIMPFGSNSYQGTEREKTRTKVNKWILESGTFDHTVDLASLVVVRVTRRYSTRRSTVAMGAKLTSRILLESLTNF
jgi:hypothetical protein